MFETKDDFLKRSSCFLSKVQMLYTNYFLIINNLKLFTNISGKEIRS